MAHQGGFLCLAMCLVIFRPHQTLPVEKIIRLVVPSTDVMPHELTSGTVRHAMVLWTVFFMNLPCAQIQQRIQTEAPIRSIQVQGGRNQHHWCHDRLTSNASPRDVRGNEMSDAGSTHSPSNPTSKILVGVSSQPTLAEWGPFCRFILDCDRFISLGNVIPGNQFLVGAGGLCASVWCDGPFHDGERGGKSGNNQCNNYESNFHDNCFSRRENRRKFVSIRSGEDQ